MRYDGKVTLVTGGSKGIGEGCVRVFAGAGAKVVFCARSRAAPGISSRQAPTTKAAHAQRRTTRRVAGRCVRVALLKLIPPPTEPARRQWARLERASVCPERAMSVMPTSIVSVGCLRT